MTKRILAVVVAVMMVMALSVVAFADYDALDELGGTLNDNKSLTLPADLDVSDGATVTLNVKGTSDNTAVRFYLTDANDVGRVTDVVVLDVLGGTFEGTVTLDIDYEGNYGGTTAPTNLMIKGPDFSTPLANTTFETLTYVGVDGAAAEAEAEAEPEAAEAAPAETEAAPAETTEAAPAPAETTTAAPNTGIALAVIPAVMALAAVAVSKKH